MVATPPAANEPVKLPPRSASTRKMPAPMAPSWARVRERAPITIASPQATAQPASTRTITGAAAPQSMRKPSQPTRRMTTDWTSTVRKATRNLPPSTEVRLAGVVKRRASVPSSCSTRMVRAAIDAPKNVNRTSCPARTSAGDAEILARLLPGQGGRLG